MKKHILTATLLFLIIVVNAQENTARWGAGIYADVARTAYVRNGERGILEGYQAGLEANYDVSKRVALTAGIEVWGPREGVGLVGGVRYYPLQNIFVRARAIGLINQTAIGAGWKKSIGNSWNLEFMADYYLGESVAARVGLSCDL